MLHFILGLLERLPLEVNHFGGHRIDSRMDQRLIRFGKIEKCCIIHVVRRFVEIGSSNVSHVKLCLSIRLVQSIWYLNMLLRSSGDFCCHWYAHICLIHHGW